MISLTNKKWTFNKTDSVAVSNYSKQYGVSAIVAEILLKRNIDDIENFLSPKLKNLMKNPLIINDMDLAVKRVCKSVLENERILIWGDYDVDGVSSTALIVNFFNEIGFDNYTYHIPTRDEGYGLTGYSNFIDRDFHLMIAVDCGSNDVEQAEQIMASGKSLIVIDHHTINETIPNVSGLVNPKLDNVSEFQNLCAAGVVFLFLICLYNELKSRDDFTGNRHLNLISYTDVVALATICDVMKLVGLNRAIVANGLMRMRLTRDNLGLSVLLDQAEVSSPNEQTIGYTIGPKLNAAGRMQDGSICVELLTSKNRNICQAISQTLYELNEKRKLSEKQVIDVMSEQATKQKDDNIIVVFGKDLDLGIIGIVASRLVDKFNKPSIVISTNGNIAKGSGRSINGVNLCAIINEARNLLINGGGHAKAIGITLSHQNITLLKQKLENIEYIHSGTTEHSIDLVLSLRAINKEMLQDILILAPFGEGNKAPCILIENVYFKNLRIVAGRHLFGNILDEGGFSISCTIFNYKNYASSIANMYALGFKKIICVPFFDEYRGKTVSLNVIDII